MTDIEVDSTKCTPATRTDNPPAVTLIEYEGRPVIIASEIGRGLGYADPWRLAKNINEKWSAEFVDGRDFVRVTNGKLAALKARLNNVPDRDVVDPQAKQLLLLTESGAQLAAILSRTPKGREFRRWLVDVALPQWRAAHEPPPPPPRRALPAPVPSPNAVLAHDMERCLNNMSRATLSTIVDELGKESALATVAYVSVMTATLRLPKADWPGLAVELQARAHRR